MQIDAVAWGGCCCWKGKKRSKHGCPSFISPSRWWVDDSVQVQTIATPIMFVFCSFPGIPALLIRTWFASKTVTGVQKKKKKRKGEKGRFAFLRGNRTGNVRTNFVPDHIRAARMSLLCHVPQSPDVGSGWSSLFLWFRFPCDCCPSKGKPPSWEQEMSVSQVRVSHNQREMENDFSFAPDLVKAS